jgi:hypothetical protein
MVWVEVVCVLTCVFIGAVYFVSKHADLAKERSLAPVDEPFVEQVFAGQSGWRLKLLHRQHPDYDGVVKQFNDNWQKPYPPTLERIFKVYSTSCAAILGSVDFWSGWWSCG